MDGGISFLPLLEGQRDGPHMELSAEGFPHLASAVTLRQSTKHSPNL